MELLNQMESLGYSLPEASTPGGNYASVNLRGKLVYVAIQFPILNGEFQYLGRLGDELTTSQGYKAMELCALNVISQVHHKIGFERILGLNHIEALFQSSENWDDSPKVVDGASDTFVKILGDKGKHSRAILGVHKLPRNFCVGLTASFTLK